MVLCNLGRRLSSNKHHLYALVSQMFLYVVVTCGLGSRFNAWHVLVRAFLVSWCSSVNMMHTFRCKNIQSHRAAYLIRLYITVTAVRYREAAYKFLSCRRKS